MADTLQVLMVNHNGGEELESRLGHLLSQSRPAAEITIVDDGSTDGSLDFLRETAKARPEIAVHANGTHRGAAYTARRLMQLAKGDYLYLAGAEDQLAIEFFDHMTALLARYPEAGIAVCEWASLHEASGAYSVHRFGWADRPNYFAPDELLLLMNGKSLIGAPAIFRRGALEELGLGVESRTLRTGFAAAALALREGLCLVPETLAVIREDRPPGAAADPESWSIDGPVLDRFLRLVKTSDLADALVRYQQADLLATIGPRALWTVLGNPDHWDIESFRLIRPLLATVMTNSSAIEEFILGALRQVQDRRLVAA